jgi:integrase
MCSIAYRKTLTRVKNWEEGRYYLKVQDAPKTRSGFRKVPLNDAIVTLLKFHKHYQLEHKMAVMDRFNDRNLVFCTGTSNFIAPRFFLKIMHRVAKRAEIRDVNVHTLRRTFATRLMEVGESIVVVQKLLGHKKLNHTLLYLESQTKTNRDAVQKLNYVIEGIWCRI